MNPLFVLQGLARRILAAVGIVVAGLGVTLIQAVKSAADGEYSVQDQLKTSDMIADIVARGTMGFVKVEQRDTSEVPWARPGDSI